MIDARIKRKKRPEVFIVFIDLRKAFDTVNRARVLEIMLERGFDSSVVRAYRNFMDGMTLKRADGSAPVVTTVGVVQGGVTSPLSFAIAIDPLLQELNKLCPTYALADDLAAVVPGLLRLHIFLHRLDKLCQANGFTVNRKKSAIMKVRTSKRQPLQRGSYMGFDFVDSYKYLGV